MNWYGDTLTWYLDRYPNDTLPFFSRIIGASQGTTFNCLDAPDSSPEWIPLRSQQTTWVEIGSFSVEQLGHDRLVLSFDLPASNYTPIAFALLSKIGSTYILVGKIVLGSEDPVPRSVKRVFNLQLPYTSSGDVHSFPRYTIESVRMTSSPSGGEYVMVDEHHHSVIYQKSGQSAVIDSYPTSLSSSRNFMESAALYTPDISGTANQPSYVYGETGNLQSEYSDMTGQKANDGTFLGGKRDRKLTTADTILNLLEVIIMANNKIQILGREIQQVSPPTGSGEERYLLVSDKLAAGDNRNLGAISYSEFLGSITNKYTTSGDPITLGASVNVVEASANATVSFLVEPSMAMVFNMKEVTTYAERAANSITVNGVSIPPGDCAILFYDGSNTTGYIPTKGVSDAISGIMGGTYGPFSSLEITNNLKVGSLEVTGAISAASFLVPSISIGSSLSSCVTLTYQDSRLHVDKAVNSPNGFYVGS